MAKETLSHTDSENPSKTSLREELEKKWPIFAAATGAAITVAGLGILLWRIRSRSSKKEQEQIDKIVESLPTPSEELDNLGVITLAEQTAQAVKELTIQGEIELLTLFINACDELGIKSQGIKTLEDDIAAASASAAQQNLLVHSPK